MPNRTKQALYDGRATIEVSASGHVQIVYERTPIQIIGFTLQSAFWLLLCYLSLHSYIVTNFEQGSKLVDYTREGQARVK